MIDGQDTILQNLSDAETRCVAEVHAKIDLIQRLPNFDADTRQAAVREHAQPAADGQAAPPWQVSLLESPEFVAAAGDLTPESLGKQLWANIRHEDPDSLLVRHLRLTAWDVDRALLILIESIRWRQSCTALRDLVAGGDESLVRAAALPDDSPEGSTARAVLAQLRSAKSFLHGRDQQGRPVIYINPARHDPGAQDDTGFEMYVLYQLETARMALRPPHTAVTVVFDLDGFAMANMDWNALRLMRLRIKEKYPDPIANVVVYRAPWVFNSVWYMLKSFVPTQRKIEFVYDAAGLAQFVDLAHVPESKGGREAWGYEFPEPVEGENAAMAQTEARDGLLKAREGIFDEYRKVTREWVAEMGRVHAKSDGEAVVPTDPLRQLAAQRRKIVESLAENYWQLDQYVRGRTQLDRRPL